MKKNSEFKPHVDLEIELVLQDNSWPRKRKNDTPTTKQYYEISEDEDVYIFAISLNKQITIWKWNWDMRPNK